MYRYSLCTILTWITLLKAVLSDEALKSFSDLPKLSSETFPDFVGESDSFVMFYASWCGHCKNLQIAWLQLAKIYQSQNLNIAIVDCTVEIELCSDENIRGYPTLMLYHGDSENAATRFAGVRSLPAFQIFIQENTKKYITPKKTSIQLENSVQVLTAENYQDIIDNGDVFIMFYTPWCSHCKKLKPTWEILASKLNMQSNPITIITKVDCTEHKKVCSRFEVSGYPTLIYFRAGRVLMKYSGSRQLEDLESFIAERVASNTDSGEESGRISQLKSHWTPLIKEPVLTVTASTFEQVIATSPLVFVEFYAPWCGHCKALTPIWELLGKHYIKNKDVVIAKVDCTEHTTVCQSQKVTGYPTLKLYKNGKWIADYSEERTVKAMSQFIDNYQVRDEL